MPDEMTTDLAVVATEQDRPTVVLKQIRALRDGMAHGFITLARLLKEARDNDYAPRWGYARFGEWVEEGSGLDISATTAYDLIRVVSMGERLGISDDALGHVKVSCLKEIAKLPEDTSAEFVSQLIEEAKTMPLKKVREVVGHVTNEDYVYHSLKFLREVEDNVYQPAVERARREYGNTVGIEGNPEDISDSKAIHMILADYLASPEEEELPVIEGEFVDVIEGDAEEAETNQAISDEVPTAVQGSPSEGQV